MVGVWVAFSGRVVGEKNRLGGLKGERAEGGGGEAGW